MVLRRDDVRAMVVVLTFNNQMRQGERIILHRLHFHHQLLDKIPSVGGW